MNMRAIALGLLTSTALACAGKQTPAPGSAPASAPASASPSAGDGTAAKITAALAGGHRSEKNRGRDAHRHPLETLTFFGLRDDMTVVELWPGGGWYTEVLAPVLAERGKLIATSTDPGKGYGKTYKALLEGNQEVFGKVQVALVVPPAELDMGPPASADLVVTFRNLHNWMSGKYADKVLDAAFRVLKPGGIFGLEEHRGNPDQDLKSGYVPEATAIQMAQAAGFKLIEKSEVNANPKDTKDYPKGVWTLPPTLREGEADKDKYMAIGESDRMTLKFVKPN